MTYSWVEQHYTHAYSEKLKIKLGLYYNREYFGNFFVPLAGVDWKASERLRFYGLLPSNYRMEIKLAEKLYTGLGFRSFQRSYRLSAKLSSDFVRIRETQLRAFLDFYMTKKFVLFAEAGLTYNYSLLQYRHAELRTLSGTNPVYTRFHDNFIFMGGIAYPIRME